MTQSYYHQWSVVRVKRMNTVRAFAEVGRVQIQRVFNVYAGRTMEFEGDHNVYHNWTRYGITVSRIPADLQAVERTLNNSL